MDNEQKYKDIEQNIKQSLAEGLNTGDFSKLSAAISESAKVVVKEAGNAVNITLQEAASMADNYKNFSNTTSGKKLYNNRQETQAYAQMLQARRKAYNEAQRAMNNARANVNGVNNPSTRNLPVKFNPVGKNSGMALIVTGAAGMVTSGATLLSSAATMLVTGFNLGTLVFLSVLVAGFGAILKTGINKRALYDKAKRYAQLAGLNMYAQISHIASAMGTTTAKVKKDIKKMLRKGFFPEGYLDDEETTLMLSDNVYKQYLSTKSYALTTQKNAEADDLENMDEAEKEALSKLSPKQLAEFKAMTSEGEQYIKRLHELNKDIPGEEITNKLNALENILKDIFKSVKVHPEQMDRMHKLMEYYLPTMIKLVEAYAEYDKVSTPGKDIIDAKREIEQTLDTINEAFVQLLNNLFQDSVWDVTSDAQVLKTMLKQEGLAKDLT